MEDKVAYADHRQQHKRSRTGRTIRTIGTRLCQRAVPWQVNVVDRSPTVGKVKYSSYSSYPSHGSKRRCAVPLQNYRSHPPPTHGQCERVARERAGGERGFPRAGVAARGQKAECTRAVRPRVKRLPYLIRLPLNAGRRNVKNYIGAYFSRGRRKRGAGKSAGAFPRGGA